MAAAGLLYCGFLWWLDGKERLSGSIAESRAAGLLVASFKEETPLDPKMLDLEVWLEKRSEQQFVGLWLRRKVIPRYWLVLKCSKSLETSVYLKESDRNSSFVRINPGFQYYLELEYVIDAGFDIGFETYGAVPRKSSVVRFKMERQK